MTHFYNLFTAMRVKDQVVDGDRAYVLTITIFLFQRKESQRRCGRAVTVRDGKLASRTVFNDSYSIAQLMQ